MLDVEAELNDVAVFDDVFFAFDAELAGFFGFHLGSQFDEVVVVDDFGCDKAALKVSMNDAGSLRCFRAFADGPGTGFLLARGEVGA